jgi:hypothetical protein
MADNKKKNMPVRYEENPFMQDFELTTTKKQVRVSSQGFDNGILVNQSTGEIQGTHVITYKKVDDAEFVKLFAANIALTFDLKSAGIKAFTMLVWMVQHRAIGKDVVPMDGYALQAWQKEHQHKSLSQATLKRGLVELERSQILAKTMRPGFYFLNPNFVFNGNRIAFTTAFERVSKDEANQQNLPLGVTS